MYRIIYRIIDFFRYDLRWKLQKIFRGYSDREIWDLGDTIAKFIEPRLKVFMEKSDAFPAEYESWEAWETDLQKMYDAVNWVIHMDEREDELIKEQGGIEREDGSWNNEFIKKMTEEHKLHEKGLELLGKNIMYLWY